MAASEISRWIATIYYRTDGGILDVTHAIEELEDLHDIVEAGPNFYAIARIEIVLADPSFPKPGLTVEEAEKL